MEEFNSLAKTLNNFIFFFFHSFSQWRDATIYIWGYIQDMCMKLDAFRVIHLNLYSDLVCSFHTFYTFFTLSLSLSFYIPINVWITLCAKIYTSISFLAFSLSARSYIYRFFFFLFFFCILRHSDDIKRRGSIYI
jgi:hypothetical protein